MADESADSRPGMIVRFLSHAKVQQVSSLAFAVIGLVCLAPMAWVLFTGTRDAHSPAVSALAAGMQVTSEGMSALMVLVGAALALYLGMRGRGRNLTRLLALSCSSLAAGFGIFGALGAITTIFGSTKSAATLLTPHVLSSFVALFLVSVFLMSMWMYATANFLLQFPKPVKLMGELTDDVARPVRFRGATFEWRWLLSPQFAALVAGVALAALVDVAHDQLRSAVWNDMARYTVCWAPFAIIATKQRQLDEEGRRAIRWVLLGQAVWLVIFLLSMLVLLALHFGGVLVFANWNDSSAFFGGFFNFFYAGFVVVLMVTLAFSILYHGTLDPDLMLRRTWVLAAVGLTSGVLFVLVERLIAVRIAGWLDISAVNALTIVGAITAAMVYPMRSWLERRVRWAAESWLGAHAIVEGRRRDAAIVFADLSGYTALTERNERDALMMAALFHRDAQQAARAHGGVLVKTIGDAVLMRFDETRAAVDATQQLEREFRAHAQGMSLEPLPIHAAVHRGEVVESTTGDVFGATVNLAARLLGAAAPGQIVASRAALESSPAVAARSQSMGERRFKNVELPIECFNVT